MKDIKGCQTFLSLKAENFGVFLCHTATLNLREYLRWGLKSNSLHGHYLSENMAIKQRVW